MFAEDGSGYIVGLLHFPLSTLDGYNCHAGSFHRIFEPESALLSIIGSWDAFDDRYGIAALKLPGQNLSHFSGPGTIVRPDKWHGQLGLLEHIRIELVIDVDDEDA